MKQIKITLIFLLCVLVSGQVQAVERSPWFGLPYQLEARATSIIEGYTRVDCSEGNVHRPACDCFLDLSLLGNYGDEYSAELEVVLADTRHRNFGFDSFLLTGRYHLLNDLVGDPVSLSAGLTLSNVFKLAAHDIGIFHHGRVEAEAHVAIGKEFEVCREFWVSRLWGVCGLGMANRGFPWLRADIEWDHNWWDRHQCGVFAHTLWGLAGHDLHLNHFHGYGSVAHHSIDLGAKYSFGFAYGLKLTVEYAGRVYGRNCPRNANFLVFRFLYPLGV